MRLSGRTGSALATAAAIVTTVGWVAGSVFFFIVATAGHPIAAATTALEVVALRIVPLVDVLGVVVIRVARNSRLRNSLLHA